MNDLLMLGVAGVAGLLLGAVFFGGLWWTVQKGAVSAHPGLWFFVSLILRMTLVIAGFAFVGQNDWRRLVAAVAGFVLARILVTKISVDWPAPKTSTQEALHEP